MRDRRACSLELHRYLQTVRLSICCEHVRVFHDLPTGAAPAMHVGGQSVPVDVQIFDTINQVAYLRAEPRKVLVQNARLGVDRFFVKVLMFFLHIDTLGRYGY